MTVLGLTMFAAGLFASVISAAPPAPPEKELSPYMKAHLAYMKQLLEDLPNDVYWGRDWCTGGQNFFWHEHAGWPMHYPQTLTERRQETKDVFAKARDGMVISEECRYLDVCEKLRDVCTDLQVCNNLKYYGCPEMQKAIYTGPFFSLRGNKDDQYMAMKLACMVSDRWFKVMAEYEAARKGTSIAHQAAVAMALFKARGKLYEVKRYEAALALGKLPDNLNVFQEYVTPGIDTKYVEGLSAWKTMFSSLEYAGGNNDWKGGLTAIDNKPVDTRLPLFMDLGTPESKIRRDECLFVTKQADACMELFLHPQEKPVTYWRRDADPGEPSLLVKAERPESYWGRGHNSPGTVHFHMSTSFLMGLCPEWKKAEDDCRAKAIADTGVKPELVGSWEVENLWKVFHDHPEYGPDDKKALNECVVALEKAEDGLYDSYFAAERLKWHRISGEEYAQFQVAQADWFKTHAKTEAWDRKARLCANFEALVPWCNGESSAASQKLRPQNFTLRALETTSVDAIDSLVHPPASGGVTGFVSAISGRDITFKFASISVMPTSNVSNTQCVLQKDAVIHIRDDASVVVFVSDHTANKSAHTEERKFEDIKIGQSVSIEAKIWPSGKLEGLRVTILRAAPQAVSAAE